MRLSLSPRLLAFSTILLFSSCDEESDEPDLRSELVGTYDMEAIGVTYYYLESGPIDGEFELENDAEIELQAGDNIKNDQILADLEEFIDILTAEFMRLNAYDLDYDIDVDEDAIAEIDGENITIRAYMFEFDIITEDETYHVLGDLDVDGEVDDDELTFDYKVEFTFESTPVIFKGNAQGLRD